MIYFIQAKLPEGRGPVKIGYTSADGVWQRLETLQTGCPWDLVILRTTLGGQREEAALHRQFKHLHMRGEWFQHSPELLEFALTQPQLEGTRFVPRGSPAENRDGEVVSFESHRRRPQQRVAANRMVSER